MRRRQNFTDSSVSELEVLESKYEVRDAKLPGLRVRVEGSGTKTYYFVYSLRRRGRWYRIGPAEMGAAAAKQIAKQLIGDVARGLDPQAERAANRGGATFAALHARYLDEYAKKRNKSWKQAEALIKRHALPRWGTLSANEISRSQVKALVGKLSVNTPILANSVRAAVSAVFAFGVKEEVLAVNPCTGVDENETNDRDRVLSATEVPLFWKACEQVDPIKAAALKVVLITAARPGEVRHMRREHVKGQWWEMPGSPVPELKWPGTKNGGSHRLFLTEQALELMGSSDNGTGFVFANERDNAVDGLEGAMREISKSCGFDPSVKPHDLRRTMGTTITGRGHGREALDRILNHRKKSVTDVYDRHDYALADQKIMEDVCGHIMRLVEGKDNVIAAKFPKIGP
jgi:integrase